MNILNQAKNNYLYIYFYFYIYLFKKTKSVSNQNFDRPSNQNNKKIVFFFGSWLPIRVRLVQFLGGEPVFLKFGYKEGTGFLWEV